MGHYEADDKMAGEQKVQIIALCNVKANGKVAEAKRIWFSKNCHFFFFKFFNKPSNTLVCTQAYTFIGVLYLFPVKVDIAQTAGMVEYPDCISAEG